MESETSQPSIIPRGMEEDVNSPSSIPSPSGDSSVEDVQMADKEPSTSQGSHRNCDKYNLRRSSVRVRVQTEQKKQQPKQRKGKIRPPPLSKYRRRTANARERSRMAEINDAFEDLKQALPQDDLDIKMDQESVSSSSSSSSSNSNNNNNNSSRRNSKSKATQPTKATVLRLAINYIAALRDILGYNVDSGSEGSRGSSCGGSSGEAGDPLSDDLGSDAASSITPSTSSGSGDEESLMSSDLDASGLTPGIDSIVMGDLDFFDSSLAADFSPDLSPDFTATLSPDEEVCLELVTSVL